MIKQFLKKALFLQFFLLLSCMLFAQEKKVTGRVLDADGKPLQGVTVGIKGTNTNVATDANGTFTITAPSNQSVLKFSSAGLLYQELVIGSRTSLVVTMQKDTKILDDVIVVGYGTKKKSTVVGAVNTIKAEDVEDLPVANLAAALVGRIPGVGVNIVSGKPGAAANISIRNPTTFSALQGITSNPLYVIDGLTVSKVDFDNLDASLIESISFLKDASAAIYGAAGDKGVVIVTTKKGKIGKAKISYSGYYGNSTATEVPKVLSAYDHAVMLNDGYIANNDADNKKFTQSDLNFLASNPYPSWYSQLWKSSGLNRHTLNVSGGSEKITFFAGGNYYNETGNFSDISIQKYGIRSGMNAKVTESVTASVSLNTDYTKDYRTSLKGSNTDNEDLMMRSIYLTPGWVPMVTKSGKPFNWAAGPNPPGAWSPLGLINSGDYESNKSQAITLNASIEFKPVFIKGLTAKVQYGKNNRSGTSRQYFPTYTAQNLKKIPTNVNGLLYSDIDSTVAKITNTDRLQQGTSYSNSYQLIGTLAYAKKIKDHDFDVMVGSEQTEGEGDSYLTYRNTQLIPGVDQMFAFDQSTTTVQLNGASESGKRSYFGRANYNFSGKYFAEVVGRYDGSAYFPADNRWGLFYSYGLGWKISDENFFRKNITFINSMKLRANWGLTGDDRVNNYQYIARFTQTTGMLFGTTVTSGLDPNIYPNPNITWEKAKTQNYGVDITLLKNHLNISVDFWARHTYDGYDDYGLTGFPYTTGIATGISNYDIQNNWGNEFSINYTGNINKQWGINVGLNFGTSNDQLIQSYYSPSASLGTINEYNLLKTGKSSHKYTGNNYGYISTGMIRTQSEVDAILAKNPNYTINGVKPQAGFLNYADINNDGKIDGNDITTMYNDISPVVGANFNIGVTYKTFRLSATIGLTVGGKKVFDSEARKVPTTNQSAPDFWKDHWTPDNTGAKYPRADAPLAKELSTFWVIDGTACRVNNMVLSYALPKNISSRYKIPDFRAFLTGTNLWNIVNPYSYKDPSTGSFAAYPTLRTISLGLNVTL